MAKPRKPSKPGKKIIRKRVRASLRTKAGATARGRRMAAILGPTSGYEGYKTVEREVDVPGSAAAKDRAAAAGKTKTAPKRNAKTVAKAKQANAAKVEAKAPAKGKKATARPANTRAARMARPKQDTPKVSTRRLSDMSPDEFQTHYRATIAAAREGDPAAAREAKRLRDWGKANNRLNKDGSPVKPEAKVERDRKHAKAKADADKRAKDADAAAKQRNKPEAKADRDDAPAKPKQTKQAPKQPKQDAPEQPEQPNTLDPNGDDTDTIDAAEHNAPVYRADTDYTPAPTLTGDARRRADIRNMGDEELAGAYQDARDRLDAYGHPPRVSDIGEAEEVDDLENRILEMGAELDARSRPEDNPFTAAEIDMDTTGVDIPAGVAGREQEWLASLDDDTLEQVLRDAKPELRDMADEEMERRYPWREGGILQRMLPYMSMTDIRREQRRITGGDVYDKQDIYKMAGAAGNHRYIAHAEHDFTDWLHQQAQNAATTTATDAKHEQEINEFLGSGIESIGSPIMMQSMSREMRDAATRLGYIPNRANWARIQRGEAPRPYNGEMTMKRAYGRRKRRTKDEILRDKLAAENRRAAKARARADKRAAELRARAEKRADTWSLTPDDADAALEAAEAALEAAKAAENAEKSMADDSRVGASPATEKRVTDARRAVNKAARDAEMAREVARIREERDTGAPAVDTREADALNSELADMDAAAAINAREADNAEVRHAADASDRADLSNTSLVDGEESTRNGGIRRGNALMFPNRDGSWSVKALDNERAERGKGRKAATLDDARRIADEVGEGPVPARRRADNAGKPKTDAPDPYGVRDMDDDELAEVIAETAGDPSPNVRKEHRAAKREQARRSDANAPEQAADTAPATPRAARPNTDADKRAKAKTADDYRADYKTAEQRAADAKIAVDDAAKAGADDNTLRALVTTAHDRQMDAHLKNIRFLEARLAESEQARAEGRDYDHPANGTRKTIEQLKDIRRRGGKNGKNRQGMIETELGYAKSRAAKDLEDNNAAKQDAAPEAPGHVAMLMSDNPGVSEGTYRKRVREHAATLSNDDLLTAYEEARAEVNEKGVARAARNVYKQELDDRRLTVIDGHGTKVDHVLARAPQKWGNHFEKKWFKHPEGASRDAALELNAKNYRRVLEMGGMSPEDAAARVDRERRNHPDDPHGGTRRQDAPGAGNATTRDKAVADRAAMPDARRDADNDDVDADDYEAVGNAQRAALDAYSEVYDADKANDPAAMDYAVQQLHDAAEALDATGQDDNHNITRNVANMISDRQDGETIGSGLMGVPYIERHGHKIVPDATGVDKYRVDDKGRRVTLDKARAAIDKKAGVDAPKPAKKARHKKGDPFEQHHLESGETLNDTGAIQRGDHTIISNERGYQVMEQYDQHRLGRPVKTLGAARKQADRKQTARDAKQAELRESAAARKATASTATPRARKNGERLEDTRLEHLLRIGQKPDLQTEKAGRDETVAALKRVHDANDGKGGNKVTDAAWAVLRQDYGINHTTGADWSFKDGDPLPDDIDAARREAVRRRRDALKKRDTRDLLDQYHNRKDDLGSGDYDDARPSADELKRELRNRGNYVTADGFVTKPEDYDRAATPDAPATNPVTGKAPQEFKPDTPETTATRARMDALEGVDTPDASNERRKLRRELAKAGVDHRSAGRRAIEAAQVAYKPTAAERKPDNAGLYFDERGAWEPLGTVVLYRPISEGRGLLHIDETGANIHVTGVHVQKNGRAVVTGTNLDTGEPWKHKTGTDGVLTNTRWPMGDSRTPQQHHAEREITKRYGPNRDADDLRTGTRRAMATEHVKNNPADTTVPDYTDEQVDNYARSQVERLWEALGAKPDRDPEFGHVVRDASDKHLDGSNKTAIVDTDGTVYGPARFLRHDENLVDDDIRVTHGHDLIRVEKADEFKQHWRVTGYNQDGKRVTFKTEKRFDTDGPQVSPRYRMAYADGSPMSRDDADKVLEQNAVLELYGRIDDRALPALQLHRDKVVADASDAIAKVRAGTSRPDAAMSRMAAPGEGLNGRDNNEGVFVPVNATTISYNGENIEVPAGLSDEYISVLNARNGRAPLDPAPALEPQPGGTAKLRNVGDALGLNVPRLQAGESREDNPDFDIPGTHRNGEYIGADDYRALSTVEASIDDKGNIIVDPSSVKHAPITADEAAETIGAYIDRHGGMDKVMGDAVKGFHRPGTQIAPSTLDGYGIPADDITPDGNNGLNIEGGRWNISETPDGYRISGEGIRDGAVGSSDERLARVLSSLSTAYRRGKDNDSLNAHQAEVDAYQEVHDGLRSTVMDMRTAIERGDADREAVADAGVRMALSAIMAHEKSVDLARERGQRRPDAPENINQMRALVEQARVGGMDTAAMRADIERMVGDRLTADAPDADAKKPADLTTKAPGGNKWEVTKRDEYPIKSTKIGPDKKSPDEVAQWLAEFATEFKGDRKSDESISIQFQDAMVNAWEREGNTADVDFYLGMFARGTDVQDAEFMVGTPGVAAIDAEKLARTRSAKSARKIIDEGIAEENKRVGLRLARDIMADESRNDPRELVFTVFALTDGNVRDKYGRVPKDANAEEARLAADIAERLHRVDPERLGYGFDGVAQSFREVADWVDPDGATPRAEKLDPRSNERIMRETARAELGVDGDLVIEHTPEGGTLIHGTSRGDGTGDVLKANGWRWSRNLGAWYVPRTRDQRPDGNKIDRTATALEADGHKVGTDIDDTVRSAAEREAAKAERADDRAAALADKADRKRAAADTAWEKDKAATDRVPPMGEPVKVGHHSERGHRRAIDRAWQTLGKAVEAEKDAKEADRRAAVAARANDARNNPVTVANRIDRLQADIRRMERARVTGPELDTARDDLTYWQGVHEQYVADGKIASQNPDDYKPGMFLVQGRRLYRIAKVNKKTLGVETEGPTEGKPGMGKINLSKITGYQVTPEEADALLREQVAGMSDDDLRNKIGYNRGVHSYGQRDAMKAELARREGTEPPAPEMPLTPPGPGEYQKHHRGRILKHHVKVDEGETLARGKIKRGDFTIGNSQSGYTVTDAAGNSFPGEIGERFDIDVARERVDAMQADRDLLGRDSEVLGMSDARLARVAETGSGDRRRDAQELLAARNAADARGGYGDTVESDRDLLGRDSEVLGMSDDQLRERMAGDGDTARDAAELLVARAENLEAYVDNADEVRAANRKARDEAQAAAKKEREAEAARAATAKARAERHATLTKEAADLEEKLTGQKAALEQHRDAFAPKKFGSLSHVYTPEQQAKMEKDIVDAIAATERKLAANRVELVDIEKATAADAATNLAASSGFAEPGSYIGPDGIVPPGHKWGTL